MDVCPEPLEWHRVYQALRAAASIEGAIEDPPKPLILAGWAFSSAREKADRWRETIAWAERHALGHITASVTDDRLLRLNMGESA